MVARYQTLDWDDGTPVTSAADAQTRINGGDILDIDETNFESNIGVIKAGAAAPSGLDLAGVSVAREGMGWLHATAVTAGPTRRIRWFTGTNSEWMPSAWCWYGPTAPSSAYEETGVLWWDTTLKLMRVFHDAADDLAGIEGWHPVSDCYQLVKNESGSTIAANRAVVLKLAGTAERAVSIATTEKDPLVYGVTLEQMLDTAYGVVATVAGGAQVDLYVDEATHALVKGDGIITAAASGYGRSVGLLESAAAPASGQMIVGTPRGCFARALGVTATNLAPVKLLGFVGAGAQAFKYSQHRIYAGNAPPTSYTATDFSVGVDNAATGTQSAVTTLISAKHAPILAVNVHLQPTMVGSNGDASFNCALNKDGGIDFLQYAWAEKDSGTNPAPPNQASVGWVPTSTGATPWTGPGNIAYFKIVTGNLTATGGMYLESLGYIY